MGLSSAEIDDRFARRADALKLVQPYIQTVGGGYRGVSLVDVLHLLGQERYARLVKDPVRGKGPTADTVYPWNVVDYLCDAEGGGL